MDVRYRGRRGAARRGLESPPPADELSRVWAARDGRAPIPLLLVAAYQDDGGVDLRTDLRPRHHLVVTDSPQGGPGWHPWLTLI